MPLAFPSNNLPGARELQFKDGKRSVAEYLADMMGSLDTTLYTFDEAVDRVNSGLVERHVGDAMGKLIKSHFSGSMD